MKTGFSYFGVRRPEHVQRDMATMRAEGQTHVLHTWSEEDLAYYPETMARIIDVSRQEGLEVYVNSWAVGRVFGGEANSELAIRNPGSQQVLSDGTPVPAICPNHPAFVGYMERWIDTVCSTNIETVFWDEPHFFFRKGDDHLWACRCDACQDGYRTRFGASLPQQIDASVTKFREDSVRDLLATLVARVHKAGKRNSVCLLPDHFNAGTSDWDAIASLPGLDELACDPYWEVDDGPERVEDLYRTYARRLFEVTARHKIDSQMWVKLYRIKAGTENLAPLATRISHEEGIRNIFAWSWRASEWMSWLRSDNPALAHERQLDAFRACHASV